MEMSETRRNALEANARAHCPVEGCKRPESPLAWCCEMVFEAMVTAYNMGHGDLIKESRPPASVIQLRSKT